jgi:RNA polymerase sigma-70 factor, ECF subfamily
MSLRPNCPEIAAAQLSAEDCEILRAKCGDESAFTPLMRRHYGDVLLVATRHAPVPHLGEDIASETFTFAWQNLARFAIGGDFGAWVRSIAWQLARARREREGCRQRTLDRYAGHCLNDHAPMAGLRANVRAHEAFDLLATLLPHRRELVVLCDYEGHTCCEAASLVGRSAAWVRTTLHRTRQELRGSAWRRRA